MKKANCGAIHTAPFHLKNAHDKTVCLYVCKCVYKYREIYRQSHSQGLSLGRKAGFEGMKENFCFYLYLFFRIVGSL